MQIHFFCVSLLKMGKLFLMLKLIIFLNLKLLVSSCAYIDKFLDVFDSYCYLLLIHHVLIWIYSWWMIEFFFKKMFKVLTLKIILKYVLTFVLILIQDLFLGLSLWTYMMNLWLMIYLNYLFIYCLSHVVCLNHHWFNMIWLLKTCVYW